MSVMLQPSLPGLCVCLCAGFRYAADMLGTEWSPLHFEAKVQPIYYADEALCNGPIQTKGGMAYSLLFPLAVPSS